MKNNQTKILAKIKDKIKKIEFNTFLIGLKDQSLTPNEKKKIKISLGKKLENDLKKTVNFQDPELLIIVNYKTQKIDLKTKPLYLFGYYQKLRPGIPQTRWHRKKYPTSVQEEIGNIILKYTKGANHSFHGCGREDIDVITLGQGRPFVIEIKKPKKRTLDLKRIKDEINKKSKLVKVKKLNFTNKQKIIDLKSAKPDKIYQVTVILEKKLKKSQLKEAGQKLSQTIIEQKTPTRVLKRRVNKTRKKRIDYFKLIKYHPNMPTFEIKTETGTYIKELIHGDNNRTQPSLSKMLNQKVKVKQLIVKKVLF